MGRSGSLARLWESGYFLVAHASRLCVKRAAIRLRHNCLETSSFPYSFTLYSTSLAMVREFTRYRRNLPHFRLDESTYFVIWRAHDSVVPLPDFAREISFNAFLHFNGERYDLIACVVMDDHVHAVLKPFPDWPLHKLVHSWKSFTAHEINKRLNRQGPVWIDESYDRIIRDETELNEKIVYIYNNPQERWPEAKDYPFLWVKGITNTRTGEAPVPPR